MPNVFATVDWLMQESLDLLVNKLSIGAHFNTEVQREFERDFAPGESVRVKFPQEYLIREGLTFNAQNLNRRTTTVSCDQIFGVHYQWDAYEKAVSLERGEAILSKEYIEPAVAQMAQEIETLLHQPVDGGENVGHCLLLFAPGELLSAFAPTNLPVRLGVLALDRRRLRVDRRCGS